MNALKWVQREIGAFGGDRSRVTIMGDSSGASSVSLLTLSPKANGLFNQAVQMSGTAASSALAGFPSGILNHSSPSTLFSQGQLVCQSTSGSESWLRAEFGRVGQPMAQSDPGLHAGRLQSRVGGRGGTSVPARPGSLPPRRAGRTLSLPPSRTPPEQTAKIAAVRPHEIRVWRTTVAGDVSWQSVSWVQNWLGSSSGDD